MIAPPAELAAPFDRFRVRSFDTVTIDERCTACGACLITCPTRALRPGPKRPTVLDDACIGCGDCVEICPTGAITEHLR